MGVPFFLTNLPNEQDLIYVHHGGCIVSLGSASKLGHH